jgi:hypothetical protein
MTRLPRVLPGQSQGSVGAVGEFPGVPCGLASSWGGGGCSISEQEYGNEDEDEDEDEL